MVPFVSKALFAMSFIVAVTAGVYGLATSDPAGTTALAFIAAGAVTLSVAIALTATDRPPYVAPDTPLAEQAPVGGRPPVPSLWPFGLALGVGLLALGAATNGEVQAGALAVLAVTAAGWLLQEFTEDPLYRGVFGRRLRERVVVPFGLPVGVVFLVAVIAISLSRVFLALPETATRAVALAVAAVILTSAFVIAASKNMARTALSLLTGFALVALIGAGIAGIIHGERKFEKTPITNASFVPRPGELGPTTTSTTVAGATSTTAAP